MKPLRETFRAWGHPNIRAGHSTTVMITRDEGLSTRGDCIVAVRAEKGLRDLDDEIKEAIKRGASVSMAIEAGGLSFETRGRGSPDLPLTHALDMVVRKSGYICGRTLMIGADRVSSDIDSELIRILQDGERQVNITIKAYL